MKVISPPWYIISVNLAGLQWFVLKLLCDQGCVKVIGWTRCYRQMDRQTGGWTDKQTQLTTIPIWPVRLRGKTAMLVMSSQFRDNPDSKTGIFHQTLPCWTIKSLHFIICSDDNTKLIHCVQWSKLHDMSIMSLRQHGSHQSWLIWVYYSFSNWAALTKE